MTNDNKGAAQQAFLLEEFIDDTTEGGFRKFIGNMFPAPLAPVLSPDYNLASFYCACQHIQWAKTHGLAFIADYQGKSAMRYGE
jgi:hypothetical protein